MKACEKCGVDLEEYECSRTDERLTVPHRPSQCLANLRAKLAECRAELEAAKREIQVGENLLSRRQVAAEACAERLSNELDEASRMYTTAQAGREAAEARAERYEALLRRIDHGDTGEGLHKMIRAALAETEKEKP